MTTTSDDRTDDTSCATCPRCRLRRGLTRGLLADDGTARHDLLEQLLDTIEAVRAVDLADDDDEHELVAGAVDELLLTVDRVHDLAGDDEGDD